jgi:hypothetical protein
MQQQSCFFIKSGAPASSRRARQIDRSKNLSKTIISMARISPMLRDDFA